VKLTEKFFYSSTAVLANEDEATATGTTTSRVQVLRTGTFFHRRFGTFTVDRATMDGIVLNFEPDRIPLDYNHGSLSEDPDRSRAAGWVKTLTVEDRDDEQFALMADVEFTSQARNFVEADEFRYISPEFTFNFTNPETGEHGGPKLMAVALTNRPFLPGMLPITLSDEGWLEENEDLFLSDKLDHLHLTDESLQDQVKSVSRKFYTTFKDTEFVQYWIEDIRDDNVIIRRETRNEGTQLFQIAYAMNDGAPEFDQPDTWVKVRKAFVPERSSQNVAGTDDQQQGRTPTQESSTTANSEDGDGIMNEEQLRELLGLDADADVSAALTSVIEKAGKVDELTADLSTLNQDIEALKTAQESTELTDGDDETVVKLTEENETLETENKALSQRLDDISEDRVALTERVDKLETEGKERDAQELIQLAQTDRKLTPAECAPNEDGSESEWVRLAREESGVFNALIERKPAFSEDLTKVVSSDKGNDMPSKGADEDFWKLVDAKQADNLEMKEHEIRALVISEHPEAARKAGFSMKEG